MALLADTLDGDDGVTLDGDETGVFVITDGVADRGAGASKLNFTATQPVRCQSGRKIGARIAALVKATAYCHGAATGPRRAVAAATARPTTSSMSPSALLVGASGPTSGSNAWTATVASTRTASLLTLARRSQPRNVVAHLHHMTVAYVRVVSSKIPSKIPSKISSKISGENGRYEPRPDGLANRISPARGHNPKLHGRPGSDS